jgi:rubredoxin
MERYRQGSRGYYIRLFQCPVCGFYLNAAKAIRITPIQHIKTMWCPMCREEHDFIQVDEWEVAYEQNFAEG